MQGNRNIRSMRSKDCLMLLRKEIKTIEELAQRVKKSAVVAIDIGGSSRGAGSSGFGDVGLAFMTDVPPEAINERIPSLGQLFGRFQPLVENLRIARANVGLRREPFYWGTEKIILDLSDVVDALRRLKQECSKDLMLVVFSAGFDMSVLGRDFPDAASLFSSWVDLQTVSKEMPFMAPLKSRSNSLENTMRIIGMHDYRPAKEHHSGNDAFRTLALLLTMVHFHTTGTSVDQTHLNTVAAEIVLASLKKQQLKEANNPVAKRRKMSNPPPTRPVQRSVEEEEEEIESDYDEDEAQPTILSRHPLADPSVSPVMGLRGLRAAAPPPPDRRFQPRNETRPSQRTTTPNMGLPLSLDSLKDFHIVRLTMRDGSCPGVEMSDPHTMLWEAFVQYNPAAIGYRGSHRDGDKGPLGCGNCTLSIYIAVRELDSLRKIVQDHHGMRVGDTCLLAEQVSFEIMDATPGGHQNETHGVSHTLTVRETIVIDIDSDEDNASPREEKPTVSDDPRASP